MCNKKRTDAQLDSMEQAATAKPHDFPQNLKWTEQAYIRNQL